MEWNNNNNKSCRKACSPLHPPHTFPIFLFINAFPICCRLNPLSPSPSPPLPLLSSLSVQRANQFIVVLAQREKRICWKMAMNCRASFGIFAAFALLFALIIPAVHGQDAFAPAPAPTSDGTAIDQSIAYGLMLLALVLTYIIHSFDVPFSI